MSIAKSYMAKAEDVETKWCVIDANGKVLGRLASQVASILQGKHKSIYASCGHRRWSYCY